MLAQRSPHLIRAVALAALLLADALLRLVEEALAGDRFAVADKLLATATKAAEKSEKIAWVARVEKRTQEVADARKAFTAIKPLLDKSGQDDKAALEVGK